jgi:hypothetical protein
MAPIRMTSEELSRRLARARAEADAPMRIEGPSLLVLFANVVKERLGLREARYPSIDAEREGAFLKDV